MKMRPRYSLLTSRSVNKGFIRLAGPTREIPSGQDGPILPTGVANHNANFASSRSLADSDIIIIIHFNTLNVQDKKIKGKVKSIAYENPCKSHLCDNHTAFALH